MYFDYKESVRNVSIKNIKFTPIERERACEELYNLLLKTWIIDSLWQLIVNDYSKQLDWKLKDIMSRHNGRRKGNTVEVIYNQLYQESCTSALNSTGNLI